MNKLEKIKEFLDEDGYETEKYPTLERHARWLIARVEELEAENAQLNAQIDAFHLGEDL